MTPPQRRKTWKGVAKSLDELVAAARVLLQDYGPEMRPKGMAADGERHFAARPYTHLPAKFLDGFVALEPRCPWPRELERHSTRRSRTDILRRAFDRALDEGLDSTELVAYLETQVRKIEAHHAEYTFVFPVDNLQVEGDYVVKVGSAELRQTNNDLWRRFTNDVLAHVARADVSDNDRGPMVANELLGESVLRGARYANGFGDASIVASAVGLPNSAYTIARGRALFLLSTLTSKSNPGWERFGQYVALQGEGLERGLGRRFRLGTDGIRPETILDGIGPSLPVMVHEGRHQDYFALVDQATRSDQAEAGRVLRTIYWLGHTLNEPTFYDEESDEAPATHEPQPQPTHLERGLRVRALVTAMESSFRQAQDEPMSDAQSRFGRALDFAAGELKAELWPGIVDAIDARHEWTHVGRGPTRRTPSFHMATALQQVVPHLLLQVQDGMADTFEDLHRRWGA